MYSRVCSANMPVAPPKPCGDMDSLTEPLKWSSVSLCAATSNESAAAQTATSQEPSRIARAACAIPITPDAPP